MDLTKEQRNTLIAWLKRNLISRKSINHSIDTSQIRTAFEYDTKIYVDNDSINDAMLELDTALLISQMTHI